MMHFRPHEHTVMVRVKNAVYSSIFPPWAHGFTQVSGLAGSLNLSNCLRIFQISRWFQRKTSGCICTSVFTWNCLIALHNCHCLEVSLEVELIVYWWEQSVEHETKASLFLWILNSDFPKLLAWEILQEFW